MNAVSPVVKPVDEVPPPGRLLLFGLQHVLVMAASPITSVFLVGRALNLDAALSLTLLSATFVTCGLGSLLQSLGAFGFGARLPFVMVPGGAPIAIFLVIAQQAGVRTAVGAVMITGIAYFLILPVFARCLRVFPPLVIGTMLLLVGVNLVKIYGGIVGGTAGTPTFGSPSNVLLALVTIVLTVIFARVLPGALAQLAVLFGLLAGSVLAVLSGAMDVSAVGPGPVFSLPTLFPFGMPVFDLWSALPLLVFSVISMAEATSQTVAVAEIVGEPIDARTVVPRTIRGDALASLFGACLGTSLIITSGENIGIIRATNVKSRYVTATAGVILVALALFAPLGRLVNAVPGAVVAGTAVIVFCVIAAIGIDMLRRVDLRQHGNLFTLASGLALGLLPILVPGLYGKFPAAAQTILGNGLAAGTLAAVLVNLLFHGLAAAPPVERATEPGVGTPQTRTAP